MKLNEAALHWFNDLSAQGILMTDAELTIRGWNNWLERHSGRRAAEMIGRHLLEAFPDLVAKRLDEYYRDALAGQVRVVSQRFHGHLLPMCPSIEGSAFAQMQQSARIAPLMAEGRVVGTITVIDDVTERVERENRLMELLAKEKAARAEAEEGKRILHALMEYIPAGVAIADAPEVTIRMVSRYSQDLTGRPAEQLVGRAVSEQAESWGLLRPDGEAPATGDELPLARATRHGEVVAHEEWVLHRPDGENLIIMCNAGPIRDSEGRTTGGVLTWMDITGRKKAEREREQLLAREQAARAEAEEANRAKDEFLATVSHELRTPLNAILGWAQILRSGKFDDESVAVGLEKIERNAKAQARLIEDILDASRIITGKLRIEVRPVNLASIVEAAIETVRPAADARSIRLEAALDPWAGLVSGDPSRLQQVVWNLLSNAIKFTPERGLIDVRLERVNAHVEITVSNTGQGIRADFLPHVFDRFRQADNSTSRKHSGLGLGLAIVRQLVELHGGTVQAESEGEGRGAKFTVRLPLMAMHRPKAPAAQEAAPAHSPARAKSRLRAFPPLDHLRVLAVDDESDAREMLETILTQCGAEVRTAGTTGEALDILRQWKPDVLISDIGMPGEDGYSLIRKVRALETEGGGRIPAVALTGYAGAEERLRLLSAGYQIHITKPVEFAELAAVLAGLVEDLSKRANV